MQTSFVLRRPVCVGEADWQMHCIYGPFLVIESCVFCVLHEFHVGKGQMSRGN